MSEVIHLLYEMHVEYKPHVHSIRARLFTSNGADRMEGFGRTQCEASDPNLDWVRACPKHRHRVQNFQFKGPSYRSAHPSSPPLPCLHLVFLPSKCLLTLLSSRPTSLRGLTSRGECPVIQLDFSTSAGIVISTVI